MFSKDFGTKTGGTVSNKYQIQLKKVFAAAEIQKQPSQISQESTESFLVKLQVLKTATLLKGDSSTDVLKLILQNF